MSILHILLANKSGYRDMVNNYKRQFIGWSAKAGEWIYGMDGPCIKNSSPSVLTKVAR